ncbi:MAG: hypothetical protein BIP78_1247 [Candidatus Bipolaricaulis sibiricus]|uniref:Uncharacterized protein n=1 Tax=Bipolaricaulis sibiricus TaxID=2501609 RepID=A0A410FVF5_BIPS1|nr:MAG: hypothetical protein BIP78_1247 [Candidatus Bipolaricaulis sibiricus]
MRIAVAVLAVVAVWGFAGWARQEPNPIPLIHGIASFALPGLGQYLNTEYDKALLHFAVDVGLIALGRLVLWPLVYSISPWYGYGVLALPHTLWALYSGWDAYTVALKREGLTLKVSPTGFALSF